MTIRKHQRRALLSWLFVGALLALCGVLAVLQYEWIGEVSVAARDRLQGGLRGMLMRLSQGLNAELAADTAGLVPAAGASDSESARQTFLAGVEQWQRVTRHPQLIRRLALALPQKTAVQLWTVDLGSDSLQQAEWPAEWTGMKSRMESRLGPEPRDEHNPPGGPPEQGFASPDNLTYEAPIFQAGMGRPFGRHEAGWVIIELNEQFLRDTLLPEVVQRYLIAGGSLDYIVEVVSKNAARSVIYQSDPRQGSIIANADASASLFEPQQFLRSGGGMGGRGPGPGRGQSPDAGRWQIFVRHRAGSLETVVARIRWRNLAIAAGLLLLIVCTASALIRFTRRTQRLAELQMDFVAGVSHELRTPLTVIHTAGYNLQGKMSRDPAQVERYGALIQKESARLNAMVEQILRFATAEAGRLIQEREPLSIENVIEEAVAASKTLIEGSHAVMEKHIAPGLPQVLGDRIALRQAVENLVSNATKYGLQGGNWIGIFASRTNGHQPEAVEIRVADHGPGIPRDEQRQIFDPFFRGARAVEDQIRGTGLGLSLVKRIVEAHGGEIRVESETAKGTAFILRLPAVPAGVQE